MTHAERCTTASQYASESPIPRDQVHLSVPQSQPGYAADLRQMVGCPMTLTPDRFATKWDLRTSDHRLCASIERGNVFAIACAQGQWRLSRRGRLGWSMTLTACI